MASSAFAPEQASIRDPNLGLGAGYQGVEFVNEAAQRVVRDGIDVIRARTGFEFRMSQAVQIGPMLGFDLPLLLDQRADGGESRRRQTVAPFLFGGISGSLDLLNGGA